MAYIFPKRELRDSDVLDPIELNQDFAPAAELASGNLDQHNFSSSVSLTVASEAYWKTHYAQQEADPGMGAPGSHDFPIPNSTYGENNNGFQIPNNGSWGAVSDINKTFISGTVNLFITAQVQYFWEGWNADAASQHSYSLFARAARVQFAIRVNGNILTETVTGKKGPFERVVRPVVPQQQRTINASTPANSTDRPGPALDYSKNTQALGPEVLPVRITATIEVPAGTQTVEVVARRLPFEAEDADAFASPYASTDRVWVMNRQLCVLEVPSYPISSTEFSAVAAPAFDSEDTISAVSIGAERIDKVRNSLNKIQPGATSRGVFTHFHLPSMMGSGTQQKTITSGSMFTPGSGSSEYPGFGEAEFTTTMGGSGWVLVGYGSNNLLSDAITIDEPCTLIVLGNVQLRRTTDPSSGGKYIWNFGCFCLGYQLSTVGSLTLDAETEVVANSYNWGGKAGNSGRVPTASILEEINVPLMQVFEFSDDGSTPFSTTDNIDSIGIYCSSTPGGGYGTSGYYSSLSNVPSIHVQRGSLTILHLKKGS
jgi:hypothetical protein